MTTVVRMRACALLALTFTAAAVAQAPASPPQPPVSPSTEMAEGEVRKVDKATGRITLRHGPLANLDMKAMTMVFRVSDPTMLDQVKEGDKVRFMADKVNGAFTVTHLQPAP